MLRFLLCERARFLAEFFECEKRLFLNAGHHAFRMDLCINNQVNYDSKGRSSTIGTVRNRDIQRPAPKSDVANPVLS